MKFENTDPCFSTQSIKNDTVKSNYDAQVKCIPLCLLQQTT